jgi:hypothetical protein
MIFYKTTTLEFNIFRLMQNSIVSRYVIPGESDYVPLIGSGIGAGMAAAGAAILVGHECQ